MSYVVLARKWRPQTFADLVGQEHVSRTLENAIVHDRVAHAFLFTGVRGVGKTTSARILAKALNCAKGPTSTPCLECHACREIADGVDVDVQEIDGASYTGIDAVRTLQESIPYRPARDRFKIYIVDEVHMLSTAAWNAFLKTLEEPPLHVKFIFATTEVNKVPVTILSRCQRYDFKLIATIAIAARLRQVVDAEGIAMDNEALRVIAREAAGSMRDAMSLLDQVIAWGGGEEGSLTAESVARVLGVAARSVLHRLGAALVDGDAALCLDVAAELAEQGFALQHVARDLLHYLRDLVVAKVSPRPAQIVDLADEELADVLALAQRASEEDLSRLYLGLSRSFDDIVRSSQPRAALEMALVRLARRPPLLPIDELIRRLADLEQRIAGGGAGGAPPAGGGGGRPARGGPEAGRSEGGRPPAAPVRAAPAPSPAPAYAAPPAPRSPAAAPQAQAAPKSAPPAPKPRELGGDRLRDWSAIVARVGDDKPSAASVLAHATPLEVEPGRVVVAYANAFLESQAAQADVKRLLEAAAEAHFGLATVIEVDKSGRHGEVETVAQKQEKEHTQRIEAARRRVQEHPLVHAALDIFKAELRDVRLPSERG
jgi:DNA polymerase-3 subunit gamma/tau